jgi:hypothetical protein
MFLVSRIKGLVMRITLWWRLMGMNEERRIVFDSQDSLDRWLKFTEDKVVIYWEGGKGKK